MGGEGENMHDCMRESGIDPAPITCVAGQSGDRMANRFGLDRQRNAMRIAKREEEFFPPAFGLDRDIFAMSSHE